MGLRALLTILVFFCAFVSTGVLASSLESRELGLADVPACGLQCIFLKAGSSGCRLDDLNCVCKNQALAAALAECMLSNCTMADTQTTARVQAHMCHLSDQSKQSHVFLITVIVYSLAFLLVALRIAGKMVSKRLSIDDWIVVTALLLGGVPLGCVLQMTTLGFGQHLWNLEDGKLLPILRLFLIASSTYVIVLALIKISLILFYLEIFTTPRFQVTAYIILAYISINSLVIFLLTVFSCRPVQSFWNRDIKGKCLDVQALAYANSASAIIQDVILLILPLVFIRKLQMKRYKKVAVGLMFSIGAFGCIATVVRLHTLLQFKISIDPTWDYAPATIWTVLELAAGFACVSLPSIRILLVFILPKRVKEMFSLFTHTSGNRSSPTPDPAQQARQWKKPSSWMSLSRDLNDSGHGGSKQDSFLSRMWSVHSSVPSTHKHMRNGSRRLESAMSNYSESAVAVTHPPYQESRRERNDRILKKIEQVELLKVPGKSKKSKKRQSERPSLRSNVSRDSQLTALPPIGRIGCLPEGSFSDLDIRRDFRGRDRKQRPDDHV